MDLREVEYILDLDENQIDCLMGKKLAEHEQYVKLANYDYEVWCFWGDYLTYQKTLLKWNIKPKKIVDIGCHLGIQSIIFDCPYLGIEAWDNKDYFWQKETNEYIVGRFPEDGLDELVNGNVVISNMSLGYTKIVETDGIAEALKKADVIFISAPESLVKEIAKKGCFEVGILREVKKINDNFCIDGRYMLFREA
ncbi:MAG: hypothetical protein IKW14_03240 [Phascolarctobacterium sp.]|nr:hypothetical protein [Phascolarctobacterium sp.]